MPQVLRVGVGSLSRPAARRFQRRSEACAASEPFGRRGATAQGRQARTRSKRRAWRVETGSTYDPSGQCRKTLAEPPGRMGQGGDHEKTAVGRGHRSGRFVAARGPIRCNRCTASVLAPSNRCRPTRYLGSNGWSTIRQERQQRKPSCRSGVQALRSDPGADDWANLGR
jgi:hypothetical protein